MIKIAGWRADPERLQTGLSVAAAACAAGVDVAVWLAGDAAWLATGAASRPAALDGESAELFDVVRQQGSVAVCARCAQRRGIAAQHLLPGIQIQGAAAFVAAITGPQVQAVVY